MHPAGYLHTGWFFLVFLSFQARAQTFPKVQYATASFSCSPSDLSSSKLTTVSLKNKRNHLSKIPRAFFQATAFNIPASSFSHHCHDKGERAKPSKQTVRSPHTN